MAVLHPVCQCGRHTDRWVSFLTIQADSVTMHTDGRRTMSSIVEEWNAYPWMQWAGARLLFAADGKSRLEMRIADHHRGAAQTSAVNGAILSYLHDIAQGAAVRTRTGEHSTVATISLTIHYIDLVHARDLLFVEGTAVRVGTGVGFAESSVRNDSGDICSTASGSFRVLRRRGAHTTGGASA